MASGDDKTDRPGEGDESDATIERTEERTLPRERVGRYELRSRIGGGSIGEVYEAFDPTIGRTVALKLIQAEPDAVDGPGRRPSGESVFRREVAAAGALLHPNIVTLYDAGRDGAYYYLAMELVDGTTFAEETRRSGRLSVERATRVGVSVAEALDFAHERGVIHRDVKPANLLVLRDRTVKVADLGIARLAAVNAVATDGTFLGTPNYVSPEQIQGATVDGRADLFSLGVVLYEALSGAHPFHRDNIAATLNAVLTFDPKPLHEVRSDVPRALSASVMRAMEKQPSMRFSRGNDFAAALRGEVVVPVESVSRRSVLGWTLGAGATVAAAGAGAWLFRDRLFPAGTSPPVVEEKGATTAPVSAGEEAVRPAPGSVESAEPVTFGVMLFKPNAANEDNDWMAEALRDAFNTELSQLSGVKVYSKEFLDFVMKKKDLSEIEAASELGIQKMLSGSFTIVGDQLRVDTYVVDVGSGVLETSYPTEGEVDDFYGLRNRILVAAVDRLDLPVSAEERRTLLARRPGNVDALKKLLEAEGKRPPRPDAASAEPEPSAAIRALEWLASATVGVGAAHAAEAASDEDAIRALLERYRTATEAGDLDALASVYDQYSADTRAAQEQYFSMVEDLTIEIEDVEMAVIGDEAVVSYTRSDEFVDSQTGRPADVTVRLTKELVRQDGQWRLVAGE